MNKRVLIFSFCVLSFRALAMQNEPSDANDSRPQQEWLAFVADYDPLSKEEASVLLSADELWLNEEDETLECLINACTDEDLDAILQEEIKRERQLDKERLKQARQVLEGEWDIPGYYLAKVENRLEERARQWEKEMSQNEARKALKKPKPTSSKLSTFFARKKENPSTGLEMGRVQEVQSS